MKPLKYKSPVSGATVYLNSGVIAFWGGVFSQWYKSSFKYGGIVFNCAEQAMMYHKAITFDDTQIALKILATSNPKEQKALGREVKNFDPDKWNKVAYDLVVDINYAKFTQNVELKDILIMTEGYDIVEASPYDKIWGVGMGEDDPDICDREKWKGKNKLGYALMDAKVRILEELR